ncbi:MAG: tetratricopeptide repeat protein [candidate division Zixibacteria bacterium]|nr:tetratricopeptide repeat protein [candidate division Zixibacteria bacterium]
MDKKPVETSSTPDSTSKFNLLIALLCGLLISAHFVSSFFPKTRLWGINHLAYFPLWVRLVFTIPGLLILVPWVNSRAYKLVDQILSFFQRIFLKKEIIGYAFCSLFFMFIFWMLRTRTYFLGDGYTLISELRGERYAKIGFEPLEIFVHLYLYKFLKLFSTPSPELIYAGLSILAGGAFIFVLVFLTRILSENRLDRLFIFSIFLFSGATELFLGYAENYTLVYISIFAYLYFSIKYLQGKSNLILPIVLCALSTGFHFSSGYLFPSLLFLLALKRKKEEFVFSKKKALPYLLVLVFLLVLSVFYIWSINPVLSEIFIPLLKGRVYAPDYTLFSVPHLLDIINQHLLLSPVGIILLVSLVIAFKDRLRCKNPIISFLTIVFLAQISYHFIIDPKLGAGRDWDLMSNLALGYILLGAYAFITFVQSRRYSALVLILSTFFCITPWFILNKSTNQTSDRFKNLLDIDLKKSLSGRYILAKHYENQNIFTTAREIRAEIFKLFPEDSLLRVAQVYELRGEHFRAESLLNRVIEMNPYAIVAYGELGNVYMGLGLFNKAIDEYQKFVRFNPFNPVGHESLGFALLRTGRFQEASEEFRKAIKLGGENALVLYYIAYIYWKSGEIDKAIKEFKKSIKMDPNFYHAHFGLGQIYLGRNALDEALVEFNEVVRLKPDFAPVYYHLGLIYSRKRLKEKAIEEFELFLSLSKDQTQNQQVRDWIQQLRLQKP